MAAKQLSPALKVYKTEHHTLGEIVELYSPANETGKAFFVERGSDGKAVGVGLRISKKTALKLAAELQRLAKGIK